VEPAPLVFKVVVGPSLKYFVNYIDVLVSDNGSAFRAATVLSCSGLILATARFATLAPINITRQNTGLRR